MRTDDIKILFFDIGGVVLSNGWGHASRKLATEKFGLDYEEVDALHNFIFNVYEIGAITLDEYFASLLARILNNSFIRVRLNYPIL